MRTLLLSLAAAGALAALVAPVVAAQAPAAGCRIALRAEAEASSFASAGRNASAARTAQIASQTGTAFAAAASHLCASRVVTPAQIRPFSKLLVRNAEGASEPAVYDDAEGSPGALIFEYAFTDGGPPAQDVIENAIRCWRTPEREGCGEDVSP